MKITALMENTGDRPGILTEHGLSIYVETDRHKILFDSGQSDAFVKNAETLGRSTCREGHLFRTIIYLENTSV